MRFLHIFLLSFFLFAGALTGTGQHLSRRAFIGVQLFPVADSLVKLLPLKSIDGVYIAQVFPKSTATNLKLQPKDVIVKINNTPIRNLPEVLTKFRELKPHENVVFEVMRQGKLVKAKGKIEAVPYETPGNGTILYDEVALANNGYARAILKKPKGTGKFPVVFYIQGYNCLSIDNLNEADSQRRLMDGLVANGYAVYRMEKPGIGDTKGTKPCREIGYKEELAAFAAGLKHLQHYPDIDTANIFLFGHSLGSNTTALLATTNKVRGIISYGATAKPWFEYLVELAREQDPMTGADYVETDEKMPVLIPMLYAFMIEKKTPQELIAINPAYAAHLKELLSYDGNDYLIGRHYSFLQDLQDISLIKAWKEAGVHTLSIYGESDLQALGPEGAQLIADIVNRYHPGKATFKLLPKTDHTLSSVASKQEYNRLVTSGEYTKYAQQNFNTEVVELVAAWMNEKLTKR